MSQAPVLDLEAIEEKRLRASIAQVFEDPDVLAAFDAVVAEQSIYNGPTLDAGGCLILAASLQRLFGGELVGIDARDESGSRSLEHVVLRPFDDRGTLVDQRGFWDDDEHLLNWLADEAEFDRPGIEEIDPTALSKQGLLYDQALVELLAERLRLALA